MASPKGNQFWKLRSKHGRDKLFATPELLWKAACEYFEWCDNNLWLTKKKKTRIDFIEEENADTTHFLSHQYMLLYPFCSDSYFRYSNKY